jgi:cobalt/nickel transport system permease protein
MHLEEFAGGNSFFHRIDPRVKFITFVPYITAIAVMQGIKAPLVGLMVSAVMILAAGIDMRKLLNRLIVVNLPILILWIFLPFGYPGEGLFSIGPFTATSEGVLYALSITLKANSIVMATIAILGTSEIFSLAHALVHLRAPVKLVYLFFFFYRYISVIHNEYTRLKKTLTARSFRPATNMHTYRTYANLIGMLIVRSYERSQRIYKAMLCRGFKGTFPVMSHFSLKNSDIAFSAAMALITVVIVII